jgi:hypothetical protein
MPNVDLLAIADDLVQLRTQVREEMNGATAEESDALFLQILEINHRISRTSQIKPTRSRKPSKKSRISRKSQGRSRTCSA